MAPTRPGRRRQWRPEPVEAIPFLLQQFEREPDHDVRWIIGYALQVLASPTCAEVAIDAARALGHLRMKAARVRVEQLLHFRRLNR